jgi:DNA-binding CsgD family transcriptional regulator
MSASIAAFRFASGNVIRSGDPGLAPAELRALQLAADGESCESSGRLLGRGAGTIKNQRRSACEKLGADNTCHAVAQAIRRGLIQ